MTILVSTDIARRKSGTFRSVITALICVASVAAACGAQESHVPRDSLAAGSEKLHPVLLALIAEHRKHKSGTTSSEPFKSAQSGLRIVDDYVVLDLTAIDDADALVLDVQTLGALDVSAFGAIVSCRFPITALMQLATVENLKFAVPSFESTI